VEHSLFPQGDGAGTTLLIDGSYNAGAMLAIGPAGPYLADYSTSFLCGGVLPAIHDLAVQSRLSRAPSRLSKSRMSAQR
jgi:hypothetical protein